MALSPSSSLNERFSHQAGFRVSAPTGPLLVTAAASLPWPPSPVPVLAAAVLPRRALPWSAAYSLCRISLAPIGSLAFAESSPTWSSRSPNLGLPHLPPIGSLPSIGNRESAPPLSAFDRAFDWESGTHPRSWPALDRLTSYSGRSTLCGPLVPLRSTAACCFDRPALSLGIGRPMPTD
jgi:hypothetical protein